MLGALIGEGRTAEVFEFGKGRAIKLMREGFGSEALMAEAEYAMAAVRAGAPAPAVLDHVEVEGRPGVVFERVRGPSMLREIASGADLEEMAIVCADLHARLFGFHTCDLPDIKERLAIKVDRSAGLTGYEREQAKRRLADLSDGNSVLHGDFHPGNIHLAEEGPVLIDWIDASRGSPAADIARTLLLVSSVSTPPDTPDRESFIEAVRRFRSIYLSHVVERMGMTEEEVDAWALPVSAARISEGITHEEATLVARVRSLID